MPTSGPVHRLAIPLEVRRTAAVHCTMGFKSVFMGVRVGSAGRQARFSPLSHSGPASDLDGRRCFCTSEGIRPVRLLEINIGAVADRAIWGYGLGPPSLQASHSCLVTGCITVSITGPPRAQIFHAGAAWNARSVRQIPCAGHPVSFTRGCLRAWLRRCAGPGWSHRLAWGMCGRGLACGRRGRRASCRGPG
jgi:hypothetical protein